MRTSGPSSCTQSSISDSSYSGDRETLVAMLMNLRSLNRVGQKETEKAGRKSEKKKKKTYWGSAPAAQRSISSVVQSQSVPLSCSSGT